MTSKTNLSEPEVDKEDKFVIKTCDLREHYDVKEEVGRGKFGVVHKVIKKSNGEIHAAKFIKIAHGKRKDVFYEVDIMKKLSHENLVNLVDVFDMDKRIVLIMEFISGGELFERIVEEDSLTESEASIYMEQILEGLKHLHGKNIVHLDLKPENVVCIEPKSTRIKLIDFGLARQLEPGKETKITCGTPEFVAPEVLNFDPVTLASDMWSVGVIAYILLSGLSPFLGDTDPETFANVTACEWDFEDESFEEVSDASKDFIEGLILSSPRKRRTVDSCLEHEWIQNHNKKSSKKLRVDNLRKFLAKKRWQKSVNAVRAIRRLSSFGAALLGKSSSLIRAKSVSSSTQSSPINEEEGINKIDSAGSPSGGEDCPVQREEFAHKRTGFEKSAQFVDKSANESLARPTGDLNELRRNFQSLSQAFKEHNHLALSEASASNGNGEEDVKVVCDSASTTPGKTSDFTAVSTETVLNGITENTANKESSIVNGENRVTGVSLKRNFEIADKDRKVLKNSTRLENHQTNSSVLADHGILRNKASIEQREVEPAEKDSALSTGLEKSSDCLPTSLDTKNQYNSSQDRPSLTGITLNSDSLLSNRNDCAGNANQLKKTREIRDRFSESIELESEDLKTEVLQTRDQEDVTTQGGLHSYLQRMIREGRLPGTDSDINMPRVTSWSCSSAASKRASFRDILVASASEEETESEDEEPIRVEVSKLKFDDFYEVQEEIGRGRFGVVNKVAEKSSGKFFAAKHIKVRAATRDLVRQEIEVLCSVRHRKIVKLHAAFEESRKFILVLELVGGGELFEKLSEEELISEGEAVFFIKQILHGVKSMHKNGILHLDLKPENIMLVDSSSAEIKIIDFGLAKKFKPDEDIKVLSGTPAFAAPEVINFEKITKATDIWSIGVIAYVLLSGVSPFLGEDVHETCSNVTRCQWDFDHHSFERVSSEAKDFISNIVMKNPKNRMTIEQCIEHQWVRNSPKKRKGQIKTRPLFRFTRSFTQSFIDGDEESRHALERPEKVDDLERRSHSNLQDIKEIKEDKITSENDAMMGTNHHRASEKENGFKSKSLDDRKEMLVLEERLKTMERDCDEMRRKLIRQTDLQGEVELMKFELEKSLESHRQLQEAILTYEQDNSKLLEKSKLQSKEINRLESRYENLKQELDEKTHNFDSLNRKYKRMMDRLEKAEDMEEIIAGLERDKTRKLDKINELEEKIVELSEVKKKDRDDDKSKKKFEKDYKALQDINESCHQELEEMDERLSVLENENTKLRKELKQQRDNRDDEDSDALKEKIEELEVLNEELERKLVNEVKNKKLIENERDSIEEEFEEERRNLESRIEKTVSQFKQLESEKREMSCLLEASKKSYFKLDEELLELKRAKKKESNIDEEANRKDDIIFDLQKEKEALKKDHDRLSNKMLALMEERQKLEEEAQSKDKGTLDRRQSGSNKEIERVKSDLKMTQEYLRIATDTNTELQLEIKKIKTDHETELNIQLIEQEARLNHVTEEEIDRVKEEMIQSNNNERKELEDRITVQDFAIRKLQALLELRESEEEAPEHQDIIPMAVNGDADSDAAYAKRIPNSVNVTISAGQSPRVSQIEETDNCEEADTLSERELRRISYKIADGVWSNLGQALCLRGSEYEDIMASSNSDQEKVYRLLVLWKSGLSQPRCVQISQLTVAVDRMRRRDISKFIKDLNARDATGLSIRKRIRNFIK